MQVHARRPALRRATAARADELYAAKFGTEGGHVPATFQARYACYFAHDVGLEI